MLDKENGRQNVFRIVKQMTKQNREVTESSCIKNKDGKIVTDECSVRKIWKEHFDKLLNEEFEWDRNGLPSTDMVCGPCEIITPEEVKVAIGEMKIGKATGPSGVDQKCLKLQGRTVLCGWWICSIRSFLRKRFRMIGKRVGWSQSIRVKEIPWIVVHIEE